MKDKTFLRAEALSRPIQAQCCRQCPGSITDTVTAREKGGQGGVGEERGGGLNEAKDGSGNLHKEEITEGVREEWRIRREGGRREEEE